MLETIVSLYCEGKNETQIKEELRLLGNSDRTIKEEFKQFTDRFKSVDEILRYNTTLKRYEKLEEIRKAYPALTFDNDGYEYISPSVREEYKAQIDEVLSILQQEFWGVSKFNNFKPRKDGSFAIRCQMRYDKETSFIGVSYISEADFKKGNYIQS